jgi:hypothetical protein
MHRLCIQELPRKAPRRSPGAPQEATLELPPLPVSYVQERKQHPEENAPKHVDPPFPGRCYCLFFFCLFFFLSFSRIRKTPGGGPSTRLRLVYFLSWYVWLEETSTLIGALIQITSAILFYTAGTSVPKFRS